jgi:hypothetical protein
VQFLFPCDYFDKKKPDDIYQSQYGALKAIGMSVSTIDVDNIEKSKILPTLQTGEPVVYRGWMLNENKYTALVKKIRSSNAEPFTDVEAYLAVHHLPNWYPLLENFTPETVVLSENADLEYELKQLGWNAFFIKDFVKSLKTSVGSIIRKPEEIGVVVAEMTKFRGEIEGGLCIRRVEEFQSETEKRYFIIFGKAFASDPEETIPDIVLECAKRIKSSFISIDVIVRADGIQRIVEVGDGQVSDIVGWSPERFASIWKAFS